MQWELVEADQNYFSISLKDHLGELQLPNEFFLQNDKYWLSIHSLPKLPLRQWKINPFYFKDSIIENTVPVIFGNQFFKNNEAEFIKCTVSYLPIDVFGSAFFMLSRYEEAVYKNRDIHDRFPANHSIAYREGFLQRPIIDEYIEILWGAMKNLWPRLNRKISTPKTIVSCDLDIPFIYSRKALVIIRKLLGDLIKKKSARLFVLNSMGHMSALKGKYSEDPNYVATNYIMDLNEKLGRVVNFYIIPENTGHYLDNNTSLDDPRMRSLMTEINERGHHIGIHPGYNTYCDGMIMNSSVNKFQQVMEELKIDQPQLIARQHFLRWESPTTARLLDDNGVNIDSTLGFADHPGFRCGTSKEYTLYDLLQRRALNIKERPLIVMECSVIEERYMGLGYTEETLSLMKDLRDTCYRFNGNFSLLWHNSHLINEKDKYIYKSIISI